MTEIPNSNKHNLDRCLEFEIWKIGICLLFGIWYLEF